MGSLTKLPYSEIGATLEILEHLGVEPGHFERIRKDPGRASAVAQSMIAGCTAVDSESKFKSWRTITLGTGLQTADDFRKALNSAGCKIGHWANDILGERGFMAAAKEQDVDLVVISVADLGFPNGATRKVIYQKAQELGLQLCPPEVGPQLRLQYLDQPMGEWLLIAMAPITDSGDGLGVFSVARGVDGLWLVGHCGRPGGFWNGFFRWAFLRRK